MLVAAARPQAMTHTRPRLPVPWLRVATLALLSAASATRRAAAQGNADVLASMPVVRSTHYIIHTDIADPDFVDDLAKRMDVMYGLYAEQLSEFRPPADAPPLPVYLFAQRSRYVTFTWAAGPNTAGLFVAGPHPFLTSYLGGQGRDALRRVLQHEAFHQFAYLTVSRHLPIWLNEGLAQVFEEGIWTGKSFLLGQVPPWRAGQLQFDANHFKLVPVATLVDVTPEAWANVRRTDAARSALYYNQAWALAEFLTRGGNAAYRARSADLLRQLHVLDFDTAAAGPTGAVDPTAASRAFTSCFPDLPGVQSAFDAWVFRLRPTDAGVLVERQTTLGDFLITLRAAGRSFGSPDGLRKAVVDARWRIHYTRIGTRYWSSPDPAVYFTDLQGVPYPGDRLYFQAAPYAPMPDLVCQESPAFRLRTHFYAGDGGRPEHELLIEPTAPAGSPAPHP